MKRFLKLSHFFCLIFLGASLLFMNPTYGMEAAGEAAVRDAAEEAFGEGAVNGLEEGAMKGAAEEIAEKMGVSVEDIGALPEEAKAEFKTELEAAFKKGGFDNVFKDGKFAGSTEFTDAVGNAQENFTNKLSGLGEDKGFSDFEYDAVKKFDPQMKGIDEFPVKSPEEIKVFEINKATGSTFKEEPPKTEAEKELKSAQQEVNSAKRDVEYADKNDPSRLDEAEKKFSKAKERETKAYKAKINESDEEINTLKSKKEAAKTRDEKQDAEKNLNKAEGNKIKEERERILREYNDIKNTKEGNPEKSTSEKKEELKKANENVREKEKAVKDAKDETPPDKEKISKAEEDLNEAKKKQEAARSEAGTKIRKEVAKEDVKNKIEGADQELKNATKADKDADLDMKTAEQKLYESGQGDWKFKRWQNVKDVINMFKEQLINGVIGGFAFSLPNFVIGPIEAAMGAKSERDTLLKPQFFGNIWMQIPHNLISGSDEPVVAKYLYVAIPNAKTTDQKAKRSHAADANTYLQHAPMYMARTEYDNYAEAPITSAQFPGEMVHLNTGFQFVGDGVGDYSWPIIQFMGKVPQGFRGIPLQAHLDKQAEDILRGVASDQYFESREQPTKYKGSPTIADQFDPKKNDQYKKDYPDEDKGYGSILNKPIQAFANGTQFGSFNVQAFSALSAEAQKALGITSPPEAKPWVAYNQYLYQTADTQNVKTARAKLAKDPEQANIADEIVEYVVMKNDGDSAVPLQVPDARSPYGIASYQFNHAVTSMLSLFDYTVYNDQGKGSPSGIPATKALEGVKIYDQGVIEQVNKMNGYILANIQGGPFTVGGKTLTIEKKWADAGANVYKIAGALEGGGDDYVIATEGFSVSALPGSPSNFISLVSSRVYDEELIPHDKKHGGHTSVFYFVYKQKDETLPPLVVVGKIPDPIYGTPITTGLKAPLYSLFMDSDINPNLIPQGNIEKEEDRAWYAKKVGVDVAQDSYPVAEPEQWALGDRGPVTQRDEKGIPTQRIGEFLQGQKEILSLINASYNSWKKYYKTLDPKAVERELGTFIFVVLPANSITIRATSPADVKNGNFVYTSPFWADEYLVLSDTPNWSGAKFATEFDVAEPQQYAISLSSGSVYDAHQKGEPVDTLKNLDQLLQKVTTKQPKLLSTLLAEIKGAQTIQEKNRQQQQYGQDTFFGSFRFYIEKEDLDAQQYVYADMTPFGNPFKMDAKKLQDVLSKANYYIGIDLKEDVKDQAELGNDNPALNPDNWVYGKKLSPKTFRVVSVVTGILYDRGGGFQGYIKEFANTIEGNLDIQKGFLDLIFGYLHTTWGKPMRSDLKTRITNLTKTEYKKLLDEKAEIAKATKEEEELYAPLNPMLKSNLDNDKAAPYVELLQRFSPIRYVKKYNNKYYTVIPDDPGPKMYIDYNVGDASKDNGVGISYDAEGNALVRLTGWALENARAYAGIIVKPGGSQELDIAIDHPAIPMAGMVKLDQAALEKKLAAARTAYQAAAKAAGNKPTDALLKASRQLGLARQEHEAAQVAQEIIAGLKKSGLYSKYTFYYNETIGAYFIGIPDVGGDRLIDLKAGYQFNPDGSPRLLETKVYYNQTTNDKNDLLFVSEEEHDLFIAVFKGKDKEYHRWSIYDEQKEYNKATKTYDHNYFATNELGGTGNIIYKAKEKDYLVSVIPAVTGEKMAIGKYVADPDRKFSLLRYFRTQDAKGGSYIADDADELEPIFIIWDGKPDLALKQLYYKRNLITLSGKGDTFTGAYKKDGQTRSITIKKVVKDHGKLVKGHYLTLTDGKNIYDFLYDTSILDPSLPVTCGTDLLKQQEEVHNLNWWKQCPGGWNLNVVADARGVNRLMMGMQSDKLKSKKVTDQLQKQAGKRAAILEQNLKLISYDSATNQYFYQITTARDSKWAYYQPEWNGWYVDLSNGVLYSINPATGSGYYPLGAMHISQLYLLLDRLEVAIVPVAGAGEPIFDSQGNPVIDPTTKKQMIGKPGIVYRSPTVVKDEKVLNQNIIDAAKAAQKQQAVGKK